MPHRFKSEAKLQHLIDKLASTDLLSDSNPENEQLLEPRNNIRIISPTSTSSQSSSVIITPATAGQDMLGSDYQRNRKTNHLRIQTSEALGDHEEEEEEERKEQAKNIEDDQEEEEEYAEEEDLSLVPPPPTYLTPGKHYALYPFNATDPSHCTIKQDDELELLNDQDSYWWLVRNCGNKQCPSLGTREEVGAVGKIGFVPVDCLEDYSERLARLNCWKNEELEKAASKKQFSSWDNGATNEEETDKEINERSIRVMFDNEVLSYDCEQSHDWSASDSDQYDDSDEEFERRLLNGFNKNFNDSDGEESGDIRLTTFETQIETNSDIASESFVVAPLTFKKSSQRRKPPITATSPDILDQSTPEPIQHPYFSNNASQNKDVDNIVDENLLLFAPPPTANSFVLHHDNGSGVGSIGTYSPSTASEYTPPSEQKQRFGEDQTSLHFAVQEEVPPPSQKKDHEEDVIAVKKELEESERNRSVWLLEELIKEEFSVVKKELTIEDIEEVNDSTVIEQQATDIPFEEISGTLNYLEKDMLEDSIEGDDLIANLSTLPIASPSRKDEGSIFILERPTLTDFVQPLSQSSLISSSASQDNTTTKQTCKTTENVSTINNNNSSDLSLHSNPESQHTVSSSSSSHSSSDPHTMTTHPLNSSDTGISIYNIHIATSPEKKKNDNNNNNDYSNNSGRDSLHPDIKTLFAESMKRFDKLELMLKEAQERLR